MVKYISKIKPFSLIVMAIKDATSPGYWRNRNVIKYIDSFGSKTYIVEGPNSKQFMVLTGAGCPFSAGC